MWNEVKRIGEYEEEIVSTLEPSIIKAMNAKWQEIEVRFKYMDD